MNKLRSIILLVLIFLILAVALIDFLVSPKSLLAPILTSQLATHFPSTSPRTAWYRASFRASPLPTTTFVAVGDIMLGRMVNVKMIEHKDFKYPFLKTAELLSSADITFGNLESPLMENCRSTQVGMVFCGRPEAIEGLKSAGFDVLSIANNHILNYGNNGLQQTTELLSKNGIIPSSNNLTMKQSNNLSFGFLSFNLTQNLTNFNDRGKLSMADRIKDEAKKTDILIISLHWGTEYAKEPASWQKELAHQIIDAGGKIIIGHHPHVTQPTEKYKDGLIFYSLGNFVFDQPWSEETKKGKIAKIVFEGKKIKSFEEIPIYITDYSQPQFSKN